MYTFVEDKAAFGRAKSFSNELMTKLTGRLKKKGIETRTFLIGSGGHNLVTQQEDGLFDLDYNLEILSCSLSINDIKDAVRLTFNGVLRDCGLSDCDDSTSSLTTKKIVIRDCPQGIFSIDVGIVFRDDDGQYSRLIHDKRVQGKRFFWSITKDSSQIEEKAREIKKQGYWDAVREDYLQRKNHYLKLRDRNHPSFVCYIETINDVYNWLKQ